MTRSTMNPLHGIYRSRNGIILGVVRGLAEHFEVSVLGARIGAVVLMMITGVWPMVIVYLIASFLMKPAPVAPVASEADEEFYNCYADSRSMARHRLKRTYDKLDNRLQRMESAVTDREADWDRRLGKEKT